jgi:hypothetical protein
VRDEKWKSTGSLFFRCTDTVSLLSGIDPLALFSRRGVGREKGAVPTTISFLNLF